MKRPFKFILAGLLALGLVLVATNAWAESRKVGTLGDIIDSVQKDLSGDKTVDMGDGSFKMITLETKGYFEVVRIKTPQTFFGPLPGGLEFLSDGFHFYTNVGSTAKVEVCFAYTPSDANKRAGIFVYGSNGWESLGGEIRPGNPKLICVSTSANYEGFALGGNP